MRRAWRGLFLGPGLASALLVGAALTASAHLAHARTLCGRVQSGGRPVRDASVLATAEGAYAKSDSTGLFCLRDLRAEVHRLQIFALGFSPLERYLPATQPETLLVELVPLRTLSSAGLSLPKAPAAGGVRTTPDVLSLAPEYLTARDSLRLARPPANAHDRHLQRFHRLLSTRASADSVSKSGSWRDVAEAILLVSGPEVADDPVANREVLETANYMLQALSVAWARAAIVENDRQAADEARRALRRRLGPHEPAYVGWAARIEAALAR